MMKGKSLVLLLIALVSLTACFITPSLIFTQKDTNGKLNLVPNGDLELENRTDPQNPDSWLIMTKSDEKAMVTWDEINKYAGKRSLKIEKPSQPILLISDSFPIDNQGAYYNRCYLKSEFPSEAKTVLFLRTFDQAGARVDNFKAQMRSMSTWQELNLSAGFFKPKAVFARIIVSIPRDPENTYWVDNLGSFHVYSFSR